MHASTPSSTPAHQWLSDHGNMLYRYALRALRHPHEAEEAVQETLLAALQGQRSFDGRSAVQTWLIGILKHKIADSRRRAQRNDRRRSTDADMYALEKFAQQQFKTSGKWAAKSRRWPGSASELCESEEFRQALRLCLERLPERAAEAVRLVEQQSVSTEQAGKILNVTPTNLCVILYRARLALKTCLERHWLETGKS